RGAECLTYSARSLRAHGEEQTARRLGLHEQGHDQRGNVRRNFEASREESLEVSAIALHPPAEVAGLRQRARVRKEGYARGIDRDACPGRDDHLARVAEETEAGDVRRTRCAGIL